MMKNAYVFRFSHDTGLDADTLASAFPDMACSDLGSRSLETCGTVPLNEGEADEVWSIHAGGLVMGMFQRLFKKIPPDVLNREFKTRLDRIKKDEGRMPGRAEKADIRDQALFALLPRAFAQSKRFRFVFDLKAGLLWIDATSQTLITQFTSVLIDKIEGLHLRRLQPSIDARGEMTRWTQSPDTAPVSLIVGEQCQMKGGDPSDQVVTIKGFELREDEVCAHLNQGLSTTRIELILEDKMSFVIDDQIDIKSIKPVSALTDEISEREADTILAEMQVMLLIQGDAIRTALNALHDQFQVIEA